MRLFKLQRTKYYIGLFVLGATVVAAPAFADDDFFFGFLPGNLALTKSVYRGTAATVTVGETLPTGVAAIADGGYPEVFENATVDGSFGVTSPIYIDQLTPFGFLLNTLAVPADLVTTSFSSKSELAVNLSQDGHHLTFMGYVAPINTLDVSNSNTPGHVDPTNPVTSSYQRAVAQVDVFGHVQVTPVDAYSGDNGRAAILGGNGNYYMVGNAGNGSGTPAIDIVNNTGVEMTTPGGSADTTVIGEEWGTPGAAKGYEYGYSVVNYGYPADKSGKDDNFRGETIFNGTLFVTKGSGGNGINTVFQVGAAGNLPTGADASSTPVTILPGFSTTLANSTTGVSYPFGIWFANATTLYVADEGDGTPADAAPPSTAATGGLQKWSFVNGQWVFDYTLQNGLNLGQQYRVKGLPSNLNPATDGLRNITGIVDLFGYATIYAVTSTVSASGDQGADSNKLVVITDKLSATTPAEAANETFYTLRSASLGEVYRGVSWTPKPYLHF